MVWRRATVNPELKAAQAHRRRAVARAMLGGAMLGAIIPGLFLAAGFFIAHASGAIAGEVNLRIVQFALAASAVLVASARGVSVAMARPLRDFLDYERARRVEPPTSERMFGQRLAQYLSESPKPAIGLQRRSASAFFLAMLPSARSAPKSPRYLRKILGRIHRMVRGGP